jgi:hypothetical protein
MAAAPTYVRKATHKARLHARPVLWDAESIRTTLALRIAHPSFGTGPGRVAADMQLVRSRLLFVRGVPTAWMCDATGAPRFLCCGMLTSLTHCRYYPHRSCCVRGKKSPLVDALATAVAALSRAASATLAHTPALFHYVHPTRHLRHSHCIVINSSRTHARRTAPTRVRI